MNTEQNSRCKTGKMNPKSIQTYYIRTKKGVTGIFDRKTGENYKLNAYYVLCSGCLKIPQTLSKDLHWRMSQAYIYHTVKLQNFRKKPYVQGQDGSLQTYLQ